MARQARTHATRFPAAVRLALPSFSLYARPSEGRMAFVPAGQAGSSQARIAWVSMQRGPRPGGAVEVMVRDIRRRNGVDAALETLAIPFER